VVGWPAGVRSPTAPDVHRRGDDRDPVVLPRARRFALDPPGDLVWPAALGIAAFVWSFARLSVPDRPIGHRARDEWDR